MDERGYAGHAHSTLRSVLLISPVHGPCARSHPTETYDTTHGARIRVREPLASQPEHGHSGVCGEVRPRRTSGRAWGVPTQTWSKLPAFASDAGC